ncbi:MAG: hypothetical protein LUP95_07335 [Euryarchaeota archaeon]|nr:hypothetical protein [Euryarchaeota archaeon]
MEDLHADIDRLMMILRADIIEGVAVALDDIQALIRVLPDHVPSLAEALRPTQEMNEAARSALESGEVFEWVVPYKAESGAE